MSLSVVCPNGHRIKAKESLAGRTVQCPKCKAALTIPLPPEPEAVEEVETFDELEEWESSSELEEQASSDPLDTSDYSLQPLPSAAQPVQQPTQRSVQQPQQTTRVPGSDRPTDTSAATHWLAAGSGLLVGLLFTAFVGWRLLADGSEPVAAEPKVTVTPKPAAEAPSLNSRTTAEQVDPVDLPDDEPPPPKTQQTAVAAMPPSPSFVPIQPAESPLDLTKVESDERLEVFKLSGRTWAADYDQTSGRLAVTNDDIGIVVYDIDDTARGRAGPVGAVRTDGLPTAVCFKSMSSGNFLIIAGNKRPKVELFDANTFEKTGEVPAPDAKFLDYLAGNPNPDDPYVYYSTQRSDQEASREREPDQLGRINMSSAEAETIKIAVGSPGRRTRVETTAILFSDQGETLYLRNRYGGAACVMLEKNLAGTDAPVMLGNGGASASCAVGTNDHLVAGGPVLFNRYYSVRLGVMDFDVEAFFPTRPLAVGFSEHSLDFGSTNDFRSLARVPLPASCNNGERIRDDFRMLVRKNAKFEAEFLRLFVDEQRSLVIAVLPEHLVVAPLSRVDLALEKSINVTARLPVKIYADQQVTVELATAAEDVTFEVGDGHDAKGANRFSRALGADGFETNLPVISNRTLTWTPSVEQVGSRWIHLRSKQGELTRDWSWNVIVEQPSTGLPFYVTGVCLDENGENAAVWGRSKGTASDPKYFLGVLDVKRRELIQTTELPEQVQSATVDPSGVYVSYDSQVLRLNRQSLEVEVQAKLTSASELQVVAGKYLAARSRRGTFERFTVPDLDPVEPAINSYQRIPLGGRLGDQWMWDGVIWDRDMTTPAMLAFPAQFGVSLRFNNRGFEGGGIGRIEYQVPGRYTGPFNAETPTYSTSCIPFGYAGFLYVEYGRLNVHKNIRHLHGERPDKPEKAIKLSSDSRDRADFGYMSCGRDVVGVAYGGKLSWHAMEELLPTRESFAVARQQSTFVLNNDTTAVKYNAKDATKFELHLWTREPTPFDEVPPWKAESTDGSFEITLDPEKMVIDAGAIIRSARFPGRDRGSLQNYLDAVTPAFEQLVGRKPNGVPVPVYAVVQAESSFREKDVFVHSYLVELPRASIEEALK